MKKCLFNSDNEPLSGLTHLIGFFLGLVGSGIILYDSVNQHKYWEALVFAIYGGCIMLAYLVSSVYHFFPKQHRLKQVFRRIDHSIVFVAMGGTFTPYCLIAIGGTIGWISFGMVWLIVTGGIISKFANKKLHDWRWNIVYLTAGWLVLLVLIRYLPEQNNIVSNWLIFGGVFYTLGAWAYHYSSTKIYRDSVTMHEVWHVLAMAGSICHYWIIVTFLV